MLSLPLNEISDYIFYPKAVLKLEYWPQIKHQQLGLLALMQYFYISFLLPLVRRVIFNPIQ